LVVGALGIASAAWFGTRESPRPVTGRFVIELPESVSTSQQSSHTVAISRDGRQLAILGAKGTDRMIFLRRLEDEVAQAVRGTEGAVYHSFSPDGQSLVFIANGSLRTVLIAGGVAQTVADSTSPTPGSWGDGRQILYGFKNALWLVSSDGGDRRMVAGPDSSKGIRGYAHPHVLPGGTHALTTGVLSSNDADRFEVDPLACPTCRGPMRIIACITQASVIDQILAPLRARAAAGRPPRAGRPSRGRRSRRTFAGYSTEPDGISYPVIWPAPLTTNP